MKFSVGTDYRFPTVVRHQGMVLVLALDEKREIYYRVLALDPAQPDDDKCWSDRKKLGFPHQIRPAGMSLVTVDLKTAERTADAPFQAVSDGKHVYLFRQSTDGTLYVDRFLFDPAPRTLNPTWEARFQRSRKRDLPASRKDTFGAKDMESQPFFEPTTELAIVRSLQDGHFCVLLLPGPLPSQWRWQIWAANSEGKLDCFSIGRSEDGLFDMADVQQTCLKWADAGLRFQAGPAALLYMQQEDAQDEYGRPQRVKRTARVMLAAPVGFSRYALELDGVDDYVSLGNPARLHIAGAITVEAWVKARATGGRRDIVAHGNGGVYLRIQDGYYQVGVGDRCASYEVPQEDLDAWTHLAGSYDSGQGVWLLFRNGIQVAQETDPTGAVTVAEDWTVGRCFAGQINNVCLWNVARTGEEILLAMHRRPAADEPGLVGHWPCDEGAGDVVHDWAAGQLHGQLRVGYALDFDGRDDHVELPAMNPDYAAGFTVEAWVRYRSFQRWSRIIDFGNGAEKDNIFFANLGTTKDLVFQVHRDGTARAVTAPGALETGTWMHLAATVDGDGKAVVYKNGQVLVEGTIDVPGTLSRARNYIGRSNWGWDGYFDGDMGEVRVWSVARTGEEILLAMHRRPAADEPGLVGHWPCDEGAGDLVHDRAAGQLHGQLRVGHGLSFDGLDDHIELPAMNPDYAAGFTVEAWVRYRSFQRWSRIIDFGNGAPLDNILFANEGTTNTLVLQVYKGGDVSAIRAPGALEIETWIHLAATVDRYGNAALYKNGIRITPDPFTRRVYVPGTLSRARNYIGRSNWAQDGYFDGDMGEVRVWNVARTQDQIRQDMGGPAAGDEPGMVGHWRLDERAGDTVHDQASGNDGVLRAGCARDTHALFFDGAGDHVELPEMNPDYAAGFTVEAWVRYLRFQNWSRIIDFGNGVSLDNILFANEGTTNNLVLQVYKDQAWSVIKAPGTLETGTWMHLAATVDGDGNATLYKNGQALVTNTIDLPDTLRRKKNYIGRSNWARDSYFDGGIQQVRVWNVARSASEIQATMYEILDGDEPGLVGYWPLDEGSGAAIRDVTKLDPHPGKLKTTPNTRLGDKWGAGPIPPDSPDAKWGGGPDNPDDKWRAGRDNPQDKWVPVPLIAILDFGVSRLGTLALIGELKDRSEVPLGLTGGANLPLSRLEADNAGCCVYMPTVAIDKKGLTVSAGLLGFAHSGETPFLLDGADGLVHLYFRGDQGKFLVAQHDTLTVRAEYTLLLDGAGTADAAQSLRFTAHRPGPEMDAYEIAIVAGSKGDTCQVTIGNSNGIRESWQDVPRDLDKFLAVLNGAATSDAKDPLVQEGVLVFYDYRSNVRREGVPDLTSVDNPYFGSALFAIGADNLPDTGVPIAVQNAVVERATRPGQASAWIPEPQGKALRLDGIDDYVALPHDKLAIAGDLAAEAWVNVATEAGPGCPMRLITYRAEGARVVLGLIKDEKHGNYKLLAESAGKVVETADAHVSPNAWTHLAAVYNATNALKLDGQGYVDCGNATDLNMKDALTVEAWVTLKTESGQRLQPEVIIAKWGAAEEDQSWRLYIDTDGKPCFETRDRQRRLIRVKANLPLEAGLCYHLAGAFDASPQKEMALKFDGEKNYVSLRKPDVLNFTGQITITGWVRVQAADGLRNIVAHGYTVNPNQEVFLRIRDGWYEIGSWNGQDHKASYPMPPEDVGTWVHLAGVYDGVYWILYRNGAQVSRTQDSTGAIQVDADWAIGARGNGTERFFKGHINNVRIWDRALSIEEIREDMDKLTEKVEGAVGNWAFDLVDSLSTEVQDHSGKGNKGTRKGDPWLKPCFCTDDDTDKCRYEQKIWVNGDLQGRRWVTLDGKRGKGYVAGEKLPPSVTARKLELDRQVAVGDQLLLQDEQVVVRSVEASASQGIYTLEVDRAVNGIAQEHRPGTEVSFLKREPNEVALTTARLNIGRSASDTGYFQGIVDDVRLWDAGRRDWQIQYFQDQPLPGEADGLVGDWRFEEGRGKAASDSKGSNHGQLIHSRSGATEQMWAPVPRNAGLSLYVNGRLAPAFDRKADTSEYKGSGIRDQFTIGAMIAADGTPEQHLSGSIDEVRLWSQVRSPEQIRDNMYRALTGAEEGLVGYWPLDEGTGTTVEDRTGNGQDGGMQGGRWVDFTAPIGNEGPEVRNACGGLEKPGFNRQIARSPAAAEYGDMQWDEEGNLFGVMKRCYILQDEALQLITGFKVGDLELNFVGQVQTAPTLIGYIEGAPPVPSENLTVHDPLTDDYAGTSAIQLTEAQETTQVYSASRDTGFDMSVDFKAGVHWAYGAEAGMFVQQSVYNTEGKLGIHGVFEHSLSWLSSATITAGTSKTLTKSLTLGGGWEEGCLNPEVGRRYLPNNMGYALVKSGTADLFALRLKRTGSLVAFQILPNPDIPEDWNIIMFPLNPKYVKNGTLDGMVGLVADPDHPGAIGGERGSYFKPLEAYELKQQIEQQAQNLRVHLENWKAGEKGRRQAATHFQEGDPGDASRVLAEVLPEQDLGYDWKTGQGRRNMVNTYVWTADGGFYAEEEQFSSIRQESWGGSYHFLGKGGVYAEAKFSAGFGFFFELDALFGGHINVEVQKSLEEKRAFGLHVDVQGEGFLNRWLGDPDRQQGRYTAEPCPGKVDAYRFMTFYLAPSRKSFDQFFDEIVDPEWLNGQGKYAAEYGPNARALREARSKDNQVWRVLHRVTYVSRIPPRFEPTPVEAVPQDVRRPANIEANIGLIRETERIKRLLPPSPEESHLVILGRAVDRLLSGDGSGKGQSESDPGEIAPWWDDRDEGVKREIRQDLMAYLKAFYESDLVPPEIGGENQRVTEGLQALYTFEEGEGKTVGDVSGVGQPLNLSIEGKEGDVGWLDGGLALTGKARVATPGRAAKLIQAAKASNALTIEAWVKPASATQRAARIVTLSAKPRERNFALDQDGDRYQVYLRTDKTDHYGTGTALEAGRVTTGDLSHLVYTRDASGQARFYVDGDEMGHREVAGRFSNWDDGYRFGLGNEISGEQPWQGELHLVAIYNRALGATEVAQNYGAGAGSRR